MYNRGSRRRKEKRVSKMYLKKLCAFWPSVCLLWRNVYLGLLRIFWLCCLLFWYWAVWAVCIFWRLIPCQSASFENIFSHSVGCLFILFSVSFALQKLLSLIRSHLFIFVFIFITLGGGSKKIAAICVKECSASVFL